MLLIQGWTISTVTLYTLIIGVIEHSSDPASNGVELVPMFGCELRLEHRYVNMREAYQVYTAAEDLDKDTDTDVIIVIDDVNLDNTNMGIVSALNKPSVIWGRRPTYDLKVTSVVDMHDDNICPAKRMPTSFTNKPYCITERDIDKINEDNGTHIFQVEFNAPSILATIVTKVMEWDMVFILHENVTGLEAARLVDLMSDDHIRVVIYNVDVYTNITDILIQTYNDRKVSASEINYVVMCHFHCIRSIFKQVNEFDKKQTGQKTLLKQFSRWILAAYSHTYDVAATLSECANDTDNIAILALPDIPSGNPVKELWKAVRCSIQDYKLQQAERDYMMEFVPFMYEHLVMKATAWMPVSSCAGVRLDTLLWTTRGREFSNVGYVSNEGKLVIFSDLLPSTKYGYNKRTFLVSTLEYVPFVIEREVNGTTVFEGICMDLLKELSVRLNFTYDLIGPSDGKWGVPDKDLNFNGLIGQLQREEVDIVAADITVQKEREMVMDFAFPYYYGATTVMMKRPDPNRRKWRTLINPFQWQVLAAIGLTLPVVSILAFVFERYNSFNTDPVSHHGDRETDKQQGEETQHCHGERDIENQHGESEPDGLRTLSDAFWYMYGALLCQGGIHLPKSVAGRTFVSCWWLFSIVIVGTYCGNLIAFLTVTKATSPFNTLTEMAEMKDEYKFGTLGGTNWEFVLMTSSRQEFRMVGDLMMEFNQSDSTIMHTDVSVHVDRVLKGGYAWIGDTVRIEIELTKDCDLLRIKDKFLPLKYSFGFTNNSPHTRIFSEQMQKIYESGILQVWKRRWWPKANICSAPVVMKAKAITIIDVQSAFYVAAGGAVIGACVLFIEMIIGKIRQSRTESAVLKFSE